ncbi:MAG: hypothetical protein U5O15_07140 [Candidatus Krumholzibacteriota bacterium]|nr:hypothetical protein [Candidatus Krumholzibacteriota bacterium]
MKAMALKEIKNMEEENNPLELIDMEIPEPGREEPHILKQDHSNT